MEKIYKSKNIFVRNLPLVIAFILPIIAMIIMYAGRGIYPFGEEMYLRSDMYHQYATFLKEFQSILKNGDSILYTWNIGLGSDLPGTYAYYLATPVYWLVAFLPTENIPEIMSGFIILKSGLMSAFFAYYVQEHTGKKSIVSAAFGIFYAFSSYMAAYSWNLMWLDCLLLLPLIALGLERLVQKKKVMLYTITLAIAILSNYYIAIMICIFLVIYFIYLVICEPGKNKGIKSFPKTLGRFALYSVLAGLMACITVLPAFVNLSATASGDFNFPKTLSFYFNVLEEISHALMNVEPTVLSGYIPNIYCTVGLFSMIPLFMLSRKIKAKEKIGKALLMIIFLFSFAMNIPTYIWHGFHYPNSLSSRESFIYIFLVLAMAYEVVIQIEKFGYVELTACFIAGAVAMYALQVLYSSETYTVLLVSLSVLFLALYYVWMMLKKSKKIAPVIMSVIFLVVALGEAMINVNVTGYKTTNRTVYMEDNEDYSELLDSIEDEGFYRVEKVTRRTKNDGAWLNYKSASEFSSTTLSAISDFYDEMGMQGTTNSFSYYGHTPLMSAFLGVKYELSSTEINDQLKEVVNSQNGYYLYQNKYSLSLGFMTDSEVMNVNLNCDTPFAAQNKLAESAAGIGDLFEVLSSASGETASFKALDSGRAFIYLKEKVKTIDVKIMRNGQIISENAYSSLENHQIVDLGDVEYGDQITVVSNDDDAETVSIVPAIMSYDVLDDIMTVLEKNQFNVEEFDDTYVKGTINAEDGQVMLTTIPYYQGWEVYVDGVKSEYTSFEDAFIAIELSSGTHTVEFKYHSPYLGAAVMISAVSILIFVMLCIYGYRKKKFRRKIRKNTPENITGNNNTAAENNELQAGRTEIKKSEEWDSAKEAEIFADMSARLAQKSQELAEISEKPLEK